MAVQQRTSSEDGEDDRDAVQHVKPRPCRAGRSAVADKPRALHAADPRGDQAGGDKPRQRTGPAQDYGKDGADDRREEVALEFEVVLRCCGAAVTANQPR